jgi:hypothetical protein
VVAAAPSLALLLAGPNVTDTSITVEDVLGETWGVRGTRRSGVMRAITSPSEMELAEIAKAHGAQSWKKTSIRNWQGPGKGVNVPLAFCAKDVLLPLALGLTDPVGNVTTVLLFERLEGVRSGGYCKLGANDYRQVGPRDGGDDAMDLDVPPPSLAVTIMEWNAPRGKLVLQGAGRDSIERWLSEYAIMLVDVAVGAPAVYTLKRWAGFDTVGDHAVHEAAILLYAGYVLQREDVARWLSLEQTLFSLLNPTTSATEGVVAPLLDWLELFAGRPLEAPVSPLLPIPRGKLAPVTWLRGLDEFIRGGQMAGQVPVPEGLETLAKLVRELRPLAGSKHFREARLALSLKAMAHPSWDEVGYKPPVPRFEIGELTGPVVKHDEVASLIDIEDVCSVKYAPPCMRDVIDAALGGGHLKNADSWPLATWFVKLGYVGAGAIAKVLAHVVGGGDKFESSLRSGKAMQPGCAKLRSLAPAANFLRCPYDWDDQCAKAGGLPPGSVRSPVDYVVARVRMTCGRPHS